MKTNGERSLVVRGAGNDDTTAESEVEVSVSMVGNMGRQAYPPTRIAASDARGFRAQFGVSLGTLTIARDAGYITRARAHYCTRNDTYYMSLASDAPLVSTRLVAVGSTNPVKVGAVRAALRTLNFYVPPAYDAGGDELPRGKR